MFEIVLLILLNMFAIFLTLFLTKQQNKNRIRSSKNGAITLYLTVLTPFKIVISQLVGEFIHFAPCLGIQYRVIS